MQLQIATAILLHKQSLLQVQDGQLQKALQALHPKYAVTNSSCYKLFCYCLQLQNDSYKIANSYKMCSLQFTECCSHVHLQSSVQAQLDFLQLHLETSIFTSAVTFY